MKHLSIIFSFLIYFYSNAQTVVSTNKSTNASNPTNSSAIFDGNASTMWGSGGYPPAWVSVDLGKSYNISEITFILEQSPSGNTKHEVYFSNDGNSWNLIETISLYTRAGEPFVRNYNNQARFVKIKTIKSPSWVAWRDIQVKAVTNTEITPNNTSTIKENSSTPNTQSNLKNSNKKDIPCTVYNKIEDPKTEQFLNHVESGNLEKIKLYLNSGGIDINLAAPQLVEKILKNEMLVKQKELFDFFLLKGLNPQYKYCLNDHNNNLFSSIVKNTNRGGNVLELLQYFESKSIDYSEFTSDMFDYALKRRNFDVNDDENLKLIQKLARMVNQIKAEQINTITLGCGGCQMKNYIATMDILLPKMNNINQKGKDIRGRGTYIEYSPVEFACERGFKFPIIKYFFEKGAKLDGTVRYIDTEYSDYNRNYEWFCLFKALENHDVNTINFILEKYPNAIHANGLLDKVKQSDIKNKSDIIDLLILKGVK